MPYTAQITRANPSCLLFLLDQSYSMTDPIPGSEESKDVFLARAINRTLQEIIIKCSPHGEVYRYFHVGIIGYGATVGPALGGSLAGQPLVWIDEIEQNPLRVEEVAKKIPDGAGGLVETTIKFPVWFDPVANNGTPMRQAFQQAYTILQGWVTDHPSAYPPVVINITDGASTDGDPSSIAAQIRDLSTDDGNVLLLTLHLSSSKASSPIAFPDNVEGSPDPYAEMLFQMSSELPGSMRETASLYGYRISHDSHGFIFNADIEDVIQFLEIGSGSSNPSNH
jgi:hypothetical protein